MCGSLTSSNCTVDTLIVGFNNFATSSIPTTVGLLTNLGMYEMIENIPVGQTPSPLTIALRYTEYLVMPSITLNGTIPSELGRLTSLGKCVKEICSYIIVSPMHAAIFSYCLMCVPDTLMLHNNQLTGTIPSMLGNLALAEKIHLYTNQLQGSVPQEICMLKELAVGCKKVSSSSEEVSPSGPDCDCCIDCSEV
jgi:hypothetical protein